MIKIGNRKENNNKICAVSIEYHFLFEPSIFFIVIIIIYEKKVMELRLQAK